MFKGSYTFQIPEVAWFTIVITGVLAAAFAFVVQTAAQRLVDSTRTGIIFALEAVFGALFAWWLGGVDHGPKNLTSEVENHKILPNYWAEIS